MLTVDQPAIQKFIALLFQPTQLTALAISKQAKLPDKWQYLTLPDFLLIGNRSQKEAVQEQNLSHSVSPECQSLL